MLERAKHLHVCTSTIVERLVTERNENGELVVTGVVLGPTVAGQGKGVKMRTVRVKREVVLSAGPFGSPHILMLRYARGRFAYLHAQKLMKCVAA